MAFHPLSGLDKRQLEKSPWPSLWISDPYLVPSPSAGELRPGTAQDLWYYPGGAYRFLFRFSVVFAIFLLAVWIAYLAR